MRFAICFLLLVTIVQVTNAQDIDNSLEDKSAFPGIPLISLGHLVEKAPPTNSIVYPRAALLNDLCGDVVIAVKIDEDGKVIESKIVRSEPPEIFDKVAEKAIKNTKFKRVTFNGEAVIYQAVTLRRFRLGPEECPSITNHQTVPSATVP